MTNTQDQLLSESLERGHDISRVSVRVLLNSSLGLVVLIVATFFLINGMMRMFHSVSTPAPAAPPERAAMQLPAGMPALEVDPAAELRKVLAQQHAFLNELQWVDRSAGIARIPIDDAIAITAEQGLPAIQTLVANREAEPK